MGQAVAATAATNAAVGAAGSTADSLVNGESPGAGKMAVAAAANGGLSPAAGLSGAKGVLAEKMSAASPTSPQGIGNHIINTTQASVEPAALLRFRVRHPLLVVSLTLQKRPGSQRRKRKLKIGSNRMKKLKLLLAAELPPLVVAVGLGMLFGYGVGLHKGALLAAVAFLILQPLILLPFFRKNR